MGWWLVLLCQPLLMVLLFMVDRLPMHRDFPNSEMLTAPVMALDLSQGGSIDDWIVAEATYLVPDVALSSLIWLTGAGPYAFLWMFVGLQLGLLALAWGWLVRFLRPNGVGPAANVALAVVLLMIVRSTVPFTFALVPYWRFGTTIMVIVGLALTLLALRRIELSSRRTWPALGLAAVAFFGMLSDEIFLVWFSAPMGLLLAVVALRRLVSRVDLLRFWFVPVGIGHALAAVVEPGVGQEHAAYTASATFSMFGTRWGEFWRLIRDLCGDSPLLVILVVIALASGVRSTRLLVRGAELDRFGMARALVGAHLVAVAVLGTVAQLMLGPGPLLGLRYSLALLVLGALVGTYEVFAKLLGQPWLQSARTQVAALLFALAVATAAVAPWSFSGVARSRTWADAVCVHNSLRLFDAERGVTAWSSQNQLNFYLRNEFKLVNATDLGPELVLGFAPYNVAWVREPLDFAVVDLFHVLGDRTWLSEASLVELAAREPTDRAGCGRWLVLYFGPGGLDFGDVPVYTVADD